MKNVFQGSAKFENTQQKPKQENNLKEIADLAYKFYVERGSKHGHDKEDWFKAENIVKHKKALKK
jgi:hypothetical protein